MSSDFLDDLIRKMLPPGCPGGNDSQLYSSKKNSLFDKTELVTGRTSILDERPCMLGVDCSALYAPTFTLKERPCMLGVPLYSEIIQ